MLPLLSFFIAFSHYPRAPSVVNSSASVGLQMRRDCPVNGHARTAYKRAASRSSHELRKFVSEEAILAQLLSGKQLRPPLDLLRRSAWPKFVQQSWPVDVSGWLQFFKYRILASYQGRLTIVHAKLCIVCVWSQKTLGEDGTITVCQ